MSDVRILRGDCLDVLRTLADGSVDALVCDPPAGIAFMGKSWDRDKGGCDAWIEWLASVMREALRVLKPGAHGLVWALPRTSHWTGMALERAGFEVRDRIAHHFGNGFPKSISPSAGLGTALKPATEDWWLVRKPLAGTVAANVQDHGTGALNIDRCRIGTSKAVPASTGGSGRAIYGGYPTGETGDEGGHDPNIGRWPANVVLSHAPECVCVGKRTVRGDQRPPQDGMREGGFGDVGAAAGDGKPCGPLYGNEAIDVFACVPWCPVRELDAQSGEPTSGASRFYYVAKPATAEREAGLEDMERKTAGELTGGRAEGSAALNCPRSGAGRTGGRANIHPTVKSIDLMRWLVRLITPPGGTVLDCFMGSGSTGCAAVLERMSFIGIEREEEYAEIARRRIAYWDAHRPADQLSLLDACAAPEPQKGAA